MVLYKKEKDDSFSFSDELGDLLKRKVAPWACGPSLFKDNLENDMNKKPDDGPAFPQPVGLHRPGMTLRDYFAGQALAGYSTLDDAAGAAELAICAYEQADAMLRARDE
jgi:hypothetical protein